jgi:hypothetical protein
MPLAWWSMRLCLDTHGLFWWHIRRRFYFLGLWGGARHAQGAFSQFERRVNHIDAILPLGQIEFTQT